MGFATGSQLIAFVQEPLATATADLAVEVATGLIRLDAGWSISAESDVEVVLDGDGGQYVWLRTLYLTAVSSLVVDGVGLTFGVDYRWSQNGWLRRIGALWPDEERVIEVTFNHGYGSLPSGVSDLCLVVAARLASNPQQLQSWSMDGASESAGGIVRGRGSLLDDEKSKLSRYRLEPGF